jgi:hypothetical protein
MAKFSLKQMIVEEISRMTDIDGTAARISKLITPKKVWILLGEWEGAEGCVMSHVIAVFKHNPTKKQQIKVEKRKWQRSSSPRYSTDCLNDERFSLKVVSCEIEP